MSELRLQADKLGHWHRPGAWLFQDLDLTLHAGCALAVLGPNGRGKSTLLRALAGIVPPRAGRVTAGCRIAFVPAATNLAFDYTVDDMVLMGRARRTGLFAQPGDADEAAADAALARLGIAHLARRAFATLSNGERQMVLLARALASEADLLLMDEPTAALDLAHQLWVADWLKRLVRDDGLALVFSTHDPNQAHDIATDVLLMHAAPHHELGPSETMLVPPRLSRLFGCDVRQLGYRDGSGARSVFVASVDQTGRTTQHANLESHA